MDDSERTRRAPLNSIDLYVDRDGRNAVLHFEP
jgi:hypothetical protein